MAIVIYPQTLDWNFMKQRPQHLMAEFGKIGHTVFFLNKTQSKPLYAEVMGNVYVVGDEATFRVQYLPEIRKQKSVVIWTTWPKLWKKTHGYEPDKVIYDCCDEFPHWARYERRMIESADAIVCSARTIFTRLQMRYPDKRIELIRNAVQSDFLNICEWERPADLPEGKPIVGYIGAWAYWVDHELMSKLLDSFPDVNFVVIGVPYGDVPSYHQKNLFLLGQKHHDQLPNYMRYFDAGIIPFQYHPITLATNPVKAYEYLSIGIPVLSTALPECIEMEPYLSTATSHKDFISKLSAILMTKPTDEETRSRIDFASHNTWSERGKKAHGLIRELLDM